MSGFRWESAGRRSSGNSVLAALLGWAALGCFGGSDSPVMQMPSGDVPPAEPATTGDGEDGAGSGSDESPGDDPALGCDNSLDCVDATDDRTICDRDRSECVQCVMDADCDAANVECVERSCVEIATCASTADCDTGLVCDGATQRCGPCVGGDCPDGTACAGGLCRLACDSDNDCTAMGMLCDPASSVCLPPGDIGGGGGGGSGGTAGDPGTGGAGAGAGGVGGMAGSPTTGGMGGTGGTPTGGTGGNDALCPAQQPATLSDTCTAIGLVCNYGSTLCVCSLFWTCGVPTASGGTGGASGMGGVGGS